MQFGKAILTGLVIWAVLFAAASILMALGMVTGGAWFLIIMWAVLLLTVWLIVGSWYKPTGMADALVLGIIWLVVFALLDWFVLVQYFMADQDPSTYYVWSIWVSYAILLLSPLMVNALRK
ncbi:MAG: hypothetical protein PHR51_02455 [Patescibacteria group bacterium]|nr:hypothetical protein [Patescibacteria group bacterium]